MIIDGQTEFVGTMMHYDADKVLIVPYLILLVLICEIMKLHTGRLT